MIWQVKWTFAHYKSFLILNILALIFKLYARPSHNISLKKENCYKETILQVT